MMTIRSLLLVSIFAFPISVYASTTQPSVGFTLSDHELLITVNDEPFATYVFHDKEIPRPYFAHLRAPGGIQVSRNYPPIAGKDLDDHATYHPGLWMTFGDISGSDYWRNKAVTKHIRFITKPHVVDGIGHFSTLNYHIEQGGERVVCQAIHHIRIVPKKEGTLLLWNAEFSTENKAFTFGDQEEMGLGVRVTTPIIVKKGGTIENCEGLKNEKEVWGKQSDWCVYRGMIDGHHVGMMLIPSPKNFRKSWFHARNYGLLLANPFGRNAFTNGEKSSVEVKAGELFSFGCGVYLFNSGMSEPSNLNTIYNDALTWMKD